MNEQYDFAFSFAGEDRELVEEIKNGLKGFNIFYDSDYQNELCGKDLYSHLRDIYKQQAKYIVCFLSKYYKQKVWTNLEFTAIKERLMATFFASEFLIPIVLDDEGYIEDIPSFIGFCKHESVQKTINLLKTKYEQSLNEDFYLMNIRNFSEYLLQKVVSRLKKKGIQAEKYGEQLVISCNSERKEIYFLPEKFSNLPCLLLHENKKENPPAVMLTWNRNNKLSFTWNNFTTLSNSFYEDISLNELIRTIENYLIAGCSITNF